MKQGRATHSNSASTKTEPISKAVDVGAVSEIGIIEVPRNLNLYEGRGLKAPMTGEQTYPSGSQGKHK